jgi:hypothetical protein
VLWFLVLDILQELGVTILQDLARQRETILHARDTLHGAGNALKVGAMAAGMAVPVSYCYDR